ncbi:2-C-methyl-D-erythritol 4-phosphate cytidylyltransferase [Granulicoccus phenolivorans]|uniref:2-C-methyl-D-erythritol 4-phosphate cytidylyltransferase n=1 Tax=Granulicoccus phenolivorans TaxID=266854 RepID=UPI0004047DD6|nr:2-C-methyl-D-erythritol 4-phosphate cytidylyltransferase [Granulicoccus phenolivorans]
MTVSGRTKPGKQQPEPVVAIVAAAGSGTRLGAALPKALVPLAGEPLVLRSVRQLAAGGVDRVVVTAAPPLVATFQQVLENAPVPCQVVAGGAERQDSVRLGLAAAGECGVLLVHDAARPLVPAAVVAAVIAAVRAGHPAVVPALPVIDSIRRVLPDESSEVVDRSRLRAVQTPQGFDPSTLRAAHEHVLARGLVVTDDAACCEAMGRSVHLVPGAREAMKITEPIDLILAEALLRAT